MSNNIIVLRAVLYLIFQLYSQTFPRSVAQGELDDPLVRISTVHHRIFCGPRSSTEASAYHGPALVQCKTVVVGPSSLDNCLAIYDMCFISYFYPLLMPLKIILLNVAWCYRL